MHHDWQMIFTDNALSREVNRSLRFILNIYIALVQENYSEAEEIPVSRIFPLEHNEFKAEESRTNDSTVSHYTFPFPS